VAEEVAERTPGNIKACERGVSGDLWGFARGRVLGDVVERMPPEVEKILSLDQPLLCPVLTRLALI